MSMFESELENLLGEFRIKMKGEIRKGMGGGVRAYFKILNHTKQVYEFEFAMLRSLICSNPGKLCVEIVFCLAGLAGFARLCPGDQYEVRFKRP